MKISWPVVIAVVVGLAIYGYVKKAVTTFIPTAAEYLPS